MIQLTRCQLNITKALLAALSAICLITFGGLAVAEPIRLLVPTVTVYPGQPVDHGRLEFRHYRAGYASKIRAVKEHSQIVGKVAGRTLVPLRPILLKSLRNPHLVKAGKPTRLVYEAGALQISTLGVPLSDGEAGDMVQVRNLDSGKILYARVSGDGSLRVSK